MTERVPAEVFPLAEFLAEEIVARGWTTTDVAIGIGGTADEMAHNLLVVDLIMCVHDDKLLIDDKTIAGLAHAFGVSPEFFRNLDNQWRKWPDRRSHFEPPESIFGPVSRRSSFRVVT